MSTRTDPATGKVTHRYTNKAVLRRRAQAIPDRRNHGPCGICGKKATRLTMPEGKPRCWECFLNEGVGL